MNFKPNKWKLIIGGFLSIALLVFLVSASPCSIDVVCKQWTVNRVIFAFLWFSIPFFILFYTIWSLIENKKKIVNSK